MTFGTHLVYIYIYIFFFLWQGCVENICTKLAGKQF